MLQIKVHGSIEVWDTDGRILTPAGQKPRGLVALLALSTDHQRSRLWLQEKLWSDRGEDQAAGSLRQALTALRKALHPHDVVITRNGTVQLDPTKITILPSPEGHDPQDLLEGINIRDAAFLEWLANARRAAGAPALALSVVPQKPTVPALVIQRSTATAPESQWVEQLIRDDIVRSLLELGDLKILDLSAQALDAPATEGPSVFLKIACHVAGGKCMASLSLETLSGNWTLWQSPTQTVSIDLTDEEHWHLRSLAQTGVAQIQNELDRQAGDQSTSAFALALANRAINTLFEFGRDDLIAADQLLKAAYEMDPKGVYLSWRAFIRNTAVFEHLTDAFLEPLETYELHTQALADDPMNSSAMVFAAQHSYVNEGDPIFGQMLCDRALEINPGNAMGWAFRSSMLILQGQPDAASQSAQRGQVLAKGQACRVSLALHGCVADMSAERYHEALNHGRMAALWGQKCQAVRRFLFVLYKALDMPLDAQKQLNDIRVREPDFAPQTLLQPGYPTPTIQRLKIAEGIK